MAQDYPQQINEFESGNFHLGKELIQLKKVFDAGAHEAVIFYAGRVLEALSADGVSRFGEQAKANVFANLEYLNDFHIFDNATLHWAHALRRQANQVRHLHDRVNDADALVALALLDHWMHWYFTRFPLGPNINDWQVLNCLQQDIRQIVAGLTLEINSNNIEFNRLVNMPLFNQSSVFGCIAAETLIDREDFIGAEQVLVQCLSQHPEDLRLKLLTGLCMSRQEQLDNAEAYLHQVFKSNQDDDETIGIYAAVLKKQWQKNPELTASLARSGRLYSKGWRRSRERNTYLGINAAAIALWTGDKTLASEISSAIVKQFEHKRSVIESSGDIPEFRFNFWELATLAEACFMMQDHQSALAHYSELLDPNKHPVGRRRIAAGQLIQHFAFIAPNQELRKLMSDNSGL